MMDGGGGGSGGTSGEEEEADLRPVMDTKAVYILMSKDHRISRNRRAEWFFSSMGTVLNLPPDHVVTEALDEGTDFFVVSAIPNDPPEQWSPQTRHEYRYKVTKTTVVNYLSRRYRIVYCIDASPSVAAVDVQVGTVMFDRVFQSLRASLNGLMRPFYIPGSTIVFQPKIFITVMTHSPFVTGINSEVIIQGKLLVPSNFKEILTMICARLHMVENKAACLTETLLRNTTLARAKDKVKRKDASPESRRARLFKSSVADFGLVDLLKQSLIALSLLPENSSSGLVILTDGVISVPDGRYLDIILSQLRYNTVSCSFIQLSSAFHPHLCHAVLPYVDLMRFIASATFGSFLTEAPEVVVSDTMTEMNIYHTAFLAWSFQCSEITGGVIDEGLPVAAKPGEWSIRNKCFFTIRDMPIVKKQQFENILSVDYMKVLSCRLREGFMIKDIGVNDEGYLEIKLVLPWKFLIQLEYVVVTGDHPDSKTKCTLALEGPYDFLHDVTCLASKSFPSMYRQLMVNRFWATRKNLSESDRLLIHLNSFSSNAAFYSIPDSIRNGVPLFYFAGNSTVPQIQPSDFPYTQFAQFWKPVCMLDTNVWQKWMHTHRIGVILEHDHPLPQYLHCPSPAGRFSGIVCRQAITALNTLLKNFGSFVLVENHSYVRLMYESDDDKSTTPTSFYLIRVTSKPPYVVLRLAFLVGTPGYLRHKTVTTLKEKISELTFPQRMKEPPRWRFPSGNSQNPEQTNKTAWSDMPCCILMNKPIEKILIRYERTPDNFCEVLMPQQIYEVSRTNQHGSFGFKTTHPTPGAPPPTIMAPEMFNTIARYLHHKRWIWYFPKCVLKDFCVGDMAEILSIITKMRLQEGFRFAYSSAGTVTMVFEVQMENHITMPPNEMQVSSLLGVVEETYLTPCVVQFVMFPPTTSLITLYDDETQESEVADERQDLFLITECWIEPQCGLIKDCQFGALNGLEFSGVADKIFGINKECILTLGAFDYLRGASRGKNDAEAARNAELPSDLAPEESLAENNIAFLRFEFELGRLLPKCSQTEMLFSMFFQDLGHIFSIEAKNEFVPFQERANEILYSSWAANVAGIHDKEIIIEPKYFDTLLTMVLSREDVTKTGKDSKLDSHDLPAWRCFVKSLSATQQLITLIPQTLRDAKLLFLIVEKCKCVLTGADADSMGSVFSTFAQYKPFDHQEMEEATKLRRRKISEPNCCPKFILTDDDTDDNIPCSSRKVDLTIGRKRIRALSGGESGPALKKAFTVDASFHDVLVQRFFDEVGSKYIISKSTANANEDLSLLSKNGVLESENVSSAHSHLDHALNSTANATMIGSLTMPLFMYDCSLSALRNHLIYKEDQGPPDSCLDFRIFGCSGDICKSMDFEDTGSTSSTSTESRGWDSKKWYEEIEFTAPEFKDYCRGLHLAYRHAYIRSVYQSLQLGYFVTSEDLRSSMKLCKKDVFTIDVSELLKNTCKHGESNSSCKSDGRPKRFVQTRFREILSKNFSCTKVDSDLFYFKMDFFNHSQDNQYRHPSIATEGREKTSVSESSSVDFPWKEMNNGVQYSDTFRHTRRGSEHVNVGERVLPLFLVLRCTFTSGDVSRTFPISDVPVCIDDLDPCLRGPGPAEEEAEEEWKANLELVILTSPSKETKDTHQIDAVESIEECANTSMAQKNALQVLANEIEWLLRDEITSLRADSKTLTADMLKEISMHVQQSKGKKGCYKQCIPLKFVVDEVKGYQKFVELFAMLCVGSLRFQKLENWWYLVPHGSGLFSNSVELDSNSEVFENESLALNRSAPESMQSSISTSSLCETDPGPGNRLPFWIIFRIDSDQVMSYFHCRYDPEDVTPTPLEWCIRVRDKIIDETVRLVRIVNQDLLLQTLHDSRMCNTLLEPESNRSYVEESSLFKSPFFDDHMAGERELDVTSSTHAPGAFACDVKWETIFQLHSRLRSGPGKSAFSRGMQILKSTLMAFEVHNRENMFVYRNTSGHVFYLRFYRVIEPFDDHSLDCPSENPSPRSSISVSSKTRMHHPSADSNKDDLPIIVRERSELNGLSTPDGIVLLRVHGVTDAGKEVKEELIQTLRNKLDDAVLDVLSVTLDRTPHCKLTPEDVHFIQKPNSPPDAVIRFTTGRFVKLLLSPFAYYLHQNLLQFLNIPKYTRVEREFHFQDYQRQLAEKRAVEEHNVYLYNQSPGETGSRGIACVSVSLVDKSEKVLHCMDWKRPWNFQFSLEMVELKTFVKTKEVLPDDPGSDIMVEVCVWKQGRINLDILKNNFLSAIKQGGWDLAMEYQILTPPLLLPEILDGEEDPADPFTDGNDSESPAPGQVGHVAPTLRRRNSSAATLNNEEEKESEGRERSWSYTVRPKGKDSVLYPPAVNKLSKSSLRGSNSSTETIRSNFDFIGSRKNIVDEVDKLHPNYAKKLHKWCNVGETLNAPSLRMETVKFQPRHYLEDTLSEIVKIINSVAPDNSTAQLWSLERHIRALITVGGKIRADCDAVVKKAYSDVGNLRLHEEKLKTLENVEEAEYPEDLLKLFTTKEHFQPSLPSNTCVFIARNENHWESCVDNSRKPDSSYNSLEVIKSLYKFFPLMSEPLNLSEDRNSLNTDKMKFPTKNGLLALLGDISEDSCMQSILVPRQRFLFMKFTVHCANIIIYNWSKESSDKLVEQIRALASWNQCRWDIMNSVTFQKAGIFYNQPSLRENEEFNLSIVGQPNGDVSDLVKHNFPPKQMTSVDRNNYKGCLEQRSKPTEVYRNVHHAHTLPLNDDGLLHNPIKIHGEQLLYLVGKRQKDMEGSVFRYWLSRGPSASNVIGKEAIEALKQTARTIHYCMTPIFFSPRWRVAIALTRDSTSGIFKQKRMSDTDVNSSQFGLLGRIMRPRPSVDKSGKDKLPSWGPWAKRAESEKRPLPLDVGGPNNGIRNTRRTSGSWHAAICQNYLQEYSQYLQTLGFIPAQGNSVSKRPSILPSDTWSQSYVGRLERARRMSDGSVLSNDSDRNSPQLGNFNQKPSQNEDKAIYLQKSLPGGIILLEVGFTEPFSHCKIHAMEVHRIQANKFAQRATSSHNTMGFVDECDKMKVLMHLHSFTYDFHLRTIQNHIYGRHIIHQGYHVTKFLDDFINYYWKGPSFARNTVNIGVLSVPYISTPSHILFDYILTNNKKYGMSALQMNQIGKRLEPSEPLLPDFALVHTLSRKVAYRESEDESHFGEFEMSLVVTHDSQPPGRGGYNNDPSVLRIKYYIVLTSKRELYPNLSGDLKRGKLFPVTAPEPLSDSPARRDHDHKRKSFDYGIDQQGILGESETESRSYGNVSDKDYSASEKSGHSGIREARVHYMGYFSSHEQMMQEIVKEHILLAEKFITSTVERAAVDCRRDLLWQRLQVGGRKQATKMKSEKDELTFRETEGALTFWEFSELLELIHSHSVRQLDPMLTPLLNQPMNFFQILIKLLANNSNHYQHRYFVAPDGKIHQLAIINPSFTRSVVLVEMNLVKQTNDINILFKDNMSDLAFKELTHELDSEIFNLIETAVGACCYCSWINCL